MLGGWGLGGSSVGDEEGDKAGYKDGKGVIWGRQRHIPRT